MGVEVAYALVVTIKNLKKMSGGHFNYDQYRIRDTWEEIQNLLDKQGTEIPKSEMYGSRDYYDKYPDEKFNVTYPSEIQKIFIEAIEILKKAEIYTQRIDWYLCGDDGEESFLRRLIDDLNKLDEK